ncbi:MAG: lysylphosphatidylglycerol synthase transmembrane domain-containing protein, partial [Microthrixaceae bacterium]
STAAATAGAVTSEAGQSPARSRRNTIIQAVIGIGLIILLFGVILPAFIDYELVFDAMRSLEIWQLGVLLVLALLRIIAESSLYSAAIPGLGFGPGLKSFLASNTVADLAPPPADLAVRFGMYKSLGISTERAGAGIIISGVFSIGARLVLPVIALVIVLVSGVDDETTWVLAALGVSALVGAGALITMMIRSEQWTARVGEWVGRAAERVAARFGRKIDAADLGTKAAEFRGRLVGVVRDRWAHASAAVIASHLVSYAVLLAALRFVGVSNAQIDWVDLLVAYAIVRLITLIPLTPGGIGVAAAGYVVLLSANDDSLANLIGAASFLTRIFVWLVPLLIGIFPLITWRRTQTTKDTESDS